MNQFLSPRRIPLKVTLLVTVDLPGEFFVSFFFFLILLGTQNGKHVKYLKTIRCILNNLLCVICDHDSQNHVLYHLPCLLRLCLCKRTGLLWPFKGFIYLLQPKNSVQRYWKTLKLLKKNLLSKSLSAVYDHNCNTFKSFRQI